MIYDECLFLREMRVITPGEVAWSILENFLTKLSHTMVALSLHLPGEEPVYFKPGNEAHRRRQLASGAPTSQLTSFFKTVRESEDAKNLTYLEVPKLYIWSKVHKTWTRRIRQKEDMIIPRLYTVNPKNRELFALRLLLKKIRGPTCFNDLKTDPVYTCFVF